MARESRESLFEGCCSRSGSKSGRRFDGEKFAFVQNGDAVGEEFNFCEGVRRKEQGGVLSVEYLGFQEAAKIGGGKSVEAARGFIEKQYLWFVKESTHEAQALYGSGRESANLAIE